MLQKPIVILPACNVAYKHFQRALLVHCSAQAVAVNISLHVIVKMSSTAANMPLCGVPTTATFVSNTTLPILPHMAMSSMYVRSQTSLAHMSPCVHSTELANMVFTKTTS